MKETDPICEQLVATAIEATIIVVESKLHGDPIPALRSHCRAIMAAREKLYRCYAQWSRADVDMMLRQLGLKALSREYRADSRNNQEDLCDTFVALLFQSPEPKPTPLMRESEAVAATLAR